MSAPRSTLLSAGAVLALTLAAPGTASAAPGSADSDRRDGDRGARSEKAERSGPDSQRRPADSARKGERAPDRNADRDAERDAERDADGDAERDADRDAGTAGDRRASGDKKQHKTRPSSRPTATTKAVRPAADPRGNNGTIKIDTVPADTARANRPHPGCTFALTFFNFDADQHADITFTGQAPTASGTLLSLSNQLISTTPADGSMEAGHTLTLSAADLGLVGTPQAAQGWHVKVAVDTLEAPGGAKQKVFWLDCPQETAAGTDEQPPTGGTADTGTDTDAGSGSGSGSDSDSDVSPAALDRSTSRDRSVGVLGVAATRARMLDQVGPAAAPARAAAARQGAAPSAGASSYRASVLPFGAPDTLPFTGAAGLAVALATGLAAVGGGALALRAGRRRVTD